MGLTRAVQPCMVVIPSFPEGMPSEGSELTVSFLEKLFFDKVDFVFAMVVHLVLYSLLLSAKSLVIPDRFLQAEYLANLEQAEQDRQLI